MSWQLHHVTPSFNETTTFYANNPSISFLSTASDGAFPVYYEPEVTTTDAEEQSAEHRGCLVFQFVINTLVIGALCIFGVAGNLVSMVILQRDRHNRVAVFLLQSLAIADSSVLIIAFVVLSLFFGLLPITGHRDLVVQASPFLIQYINPLGYAAQSCTIWLTVLLAINRYIAVCKPFKADAWLTMRLAVVQVSLVIFLSFGLNVPRFFLYEYEFSSTVIVNSTDGGNWSTSIENRSWRHFSALGQDRVFEIAYLTTFYTAFVLVMPLILLCGFNLMIALSLRASRRNMRLNSLGGAYRGQEESSITVVMVAVVAELIICHLPDRVVMIMRYVMYPDGSESPSCPDIMSILENVFNMLVIISSSTNFIIYFALRRRFRETLRRRLLIVCFARCRPEEVDRLYRTSNEGSFDMRHRSVSRVGSNDSGVRGSAIECSNKSTLIQISSTSAVKRTNSGDKRDVEMTLPVRWWSSCLARCRDKPGAKRRSEHVNGVSVDASNRCGRRNGTMTSQGRCRSNESDVDGCALNGMADADKSQNRNGNSNRPRRSVEFS